MMGRNGTAISQSDRAHTVPFRLALPGSSIQGGREGQERAGDWNAIAQVVASLGEDNFEHELFAWVSGFASLGVLFAIEIDERAQEGRVLITEGRSETITQRAKKISRDYADTDYAIDDVYCRFAAKAPGNVAVLVQSAADREGPFRLKYFDNVGTREEISVFERDASGTFYLGFSSTKAGYSAAEVRSIRAAIPLVSSLIRRHTSLIASRGNRHEPVERRLPAIRATLINHEAGLTDREADVCAAIVVGYRAEAIGYRLGISANTVATHRKRAYRKLCISSQTELFRIFYNKG